MAVDLLVAREPAIQKMLRNCMKIAERSSAKKSAIRAFYCGLELAYSIRAADVLHTIAQNSFPDFPHDIDRHLNLAIPGDQLRIPISIAGSYDDLEVKIEVQLSKITNSASRPAALLGLGENTDCDLDKYLLDVLLRGQLVVLGRKGHYLSSRRLGIITALHGTWLLATAIDSSLARELQDCRMELAADSSDNWSAKRYTAWVQRIRSASIRHRDIGNDWAFNERDKMLLEQYLRANELLIECMDAARGLKNETRQFVEATMFLPCDEIPETPDWEMRS